MVSGCKTRKVNGALKQWVAFVKKVQKEEGISYPDAIHRAKVRKDSGEKWKHKVGGSNGELEVVEPNTVDDVVVSEDVDGDDVSMDVDGDDVSMDVVGDDVEEVSAPIGGRRRRKSAKRTGSKSRSSSLYRIVASDLGSLSSAAERYGRSLSAKASEASRKGRKSRAKALGSKSAAYENAGRSVERMAKDVDFMKHYRSFSSGNTRSGRSVFGGKGRKTRRH